MDTKYENLLKKPIVIDPYNYKVFVAIGEKEFEVLKDSYPDWYQEDEVFTETKHPIDIIPGTYAQVSRVKDKNGADFAILYIDDIKDEDFEKTLIHECLHVVLGALDSRGIPISMTNEEIMCYHLEHLWGLVKELIKKRGY